MAVRELFNRPKTSQLIADEAMGYSTKSTGR
jgi:hypothetical protein